MSKNNITNTAIVRGSTCLVSGPHRNPRDEVVTTAYADVVPEVSEVFTGEPPFARAQSELVRK